MPTIDPFGPFFSFFFLRFWRPVTSSIVMIGLVDNLFPSSSNRYHLVDANQSDISIRLNGNSFVYTFLDAVLEPVIGTLR